ncbi:Cupredoxin-like domain protein [uncultured archaeon]|nr:Cupredoxin-like domain protein [uncultured archaeon]
MKNLYLIGGIVVLILFVGGFLYFDFGSQNYTPNSSSNVVSGDYQKVVLSMKNYNYYPNTITVKAGQPVRIYLDSSVGGCYRSFNIQQLGISKYLATTSDYVEFTPTQKGTYRFACSMGMGTGTLIVE